MLENNFVEDYKRVNTLKNDQKDQDIKGENILLPREQNSTFRICIDSCRM